MSDAWKLVEETFSDLFRRVTQLEAVATPLVTTKVISLFMTIPGLRGFWPMSSVDYTAADRAIDVSGQDNHLTANASAADVQFAFGGLTPAQGLAPFVNLIAVNQNYLSKADGGAANWADIIGTEGYIPAAQRGLTFGAWFFLDAIPITVSGLIGKYTATANQKSYLIALSSVNTFFRISTDGSANYDATTGATQPVGTWVFMVLRWDPSTDLTGFINGDIAAENTAVVPATVFDSTADFTIGAANISGALDFFDGRCSMAFLSAIAVSDDLVKQLFEESRGLFGV